MNLTTMKRFVTSKFARQVLKTQEASPTILLGAGIVGVVATAVLASKATLQLESVLDVHEERVAQRAVLIREGNVNYTDSMARSDAALIYVKTTGNVIKLYGPTLIVGGMTIASMVSSHRILSGRNAALTAAYATLDMAYREYRQRVRDEYGEEVDHKFHHGRADIPEVDSKGKETGKVVETKGRGVSPYTFLFDEFNDNWNERAEYNLLFLRSQQNWANDRLKARGHVFLNEVLDDLGLPRTEAGAVVGWLHDGSGDNYIDFGLFNASDRQDSAIYNVVSGQEKAIWLDFNVDGTIYDKI